MLLVFKLLVSFGILNVWFVRQHKKTNWRGGDTLSLKDEFKFYSLPIWTYYFVGTTKVISAILIFFSIWINSIPYKSLALIISFLMVFSILMHLKVKDKYVKSIPAFSMLILSLIVLNI